MPEQKEGDSGFKVVDRRSFTTDGTPRQAGPETGEPKREASPPMPRSSPGPVEAEPLEPFGDNPAGFETLVSYLSTTALFQMGLLQGPSGERIPPDLANARRTIDLLEILQDKTQGNLTADESKFIEDILAELRWSFVELDRSREKKAR